MEPIRLEVIAPMLQGMSFCAPCELVMEGAGLGQHAAEHALDEYPQEWQEDHRRLTEWLSDLADRHGSRLRIRAIDPQSPEGLWKSLRYWVRRYPTWIVNGKKCVVGWDRPALDAALEQAMEGQHV
ncbi:MAG TPA: hypothetical protein ENJ31_03610 [Anaerolineae bacterium]|nr:hypothetical protein [Anaerolineae bacterium]